LGFGVWGLGFGVWGLGFGVWGLGFGVWGHGVSDLGLGLKFRVYPSVPMPTTNSRNDTRPEPPVSNTAVP
jgi:hypothetical protein